MIGEVIQGNHLGDTWWVMVAACLKDLDEDEFEVMGAEAFINLRGQVHWIENPEPKRAVIECLVSLPWDEPHPLQGDVTLVDEYCRTLTEYEWDRKSATETVRRLVWLTGIGVVVKALARHLDENEIFPLLEGVGVGFLLEGDWGNLDDDLRQRVIRASRMRSRVEILSHYMSLLNPDWNAALEISPLLPCCKSSARRNGFIDDCWLAWKVDEGVISRVEADRLARLGSSWTAEQSDDECARVRREVYEEILAQGDPLSWMHQLPEPMPKPKSD